MIRLYLRTLTSYIPQTQLEHVVRIKWESSEKLYVTQLLLKFYIVSSNPDILFFSMYRDRAQPDRYSHPDPFEDTKAEFQEAYAREQFLCRKLSRYYLFWLQPWNEKPISSHCIQGRIRGCVMEGTDRCFQDKARIFPKLQRIPTPLSPQKHHYKKGLWMLRGNRKHSTVTKLWFPLLL